MRGISIHRSMGLIAWTLLTWPGMILAQLTSLTPTPTPSAATSSPAQDERGFLVAQDGNESSYATLKPARYQNQLGLAVVFTGTDGLHYYADPNTSSGFNLKIIVQTDPNRFAAPIFPTPDPYFEPAYNEDIQVYEGDFTVFLPLRAELNPPAPGNVTVMIDAMACTRRACLAPFQRVITANVDFSQPMDLSVLKISRPQAAGPKTDMVATSPSGPGYATWIYMLLALGAGLSINIMPCVLPVIPLIIMRLIGKAQDSPAQRLRSGLAFCAGIILFFIAFAIVASLINVTTGQVLDLNSLFRYPVAVTVLFLAIVFFALVMLDVVVLAVPGAVAGHQSDSSTLTGSIGMGFFAGILSTPCSGALLGFVLVWAQTQPLLISNTAIVLMGVGMALPYAVIVSTPKLLDRVPKPGTWMELFKKSCGFLLLLIAVKLTLAGLPKDRLIHVLLYGVIFSFCVWMWGQWVSFNTARARRLSVRGLAILIAVVTGAWLLPAPPQELQLDWHSYDEAAIQQVRDQGQPVLIKFTADWCTNCKVLERRVFEDPEVIDWLQQKDVYMVKADTTLKGPRYPATAALSEVYGQAGNVPYTVVWLPDGSRHDLPGMFSKHALHDVLAQMEN